MTNHKEQLINSKCTCDDCREPELLPWHYSQRFEGKAYDIYNPNDVNSWVCQVCSELEAQTIVNAVNAFTRPQKKEEPTCTCKIGEGYCLIHSGEPIEHKKEEPTNKSIEKQIAWCECGDGLIQQEDGDYYCIGCDDTYKLVKVKKEEPTCEHDWQYNSDIKGVAQCSICNEYQLPKKEEPAMELNEPTTLMKIEELTETISQCLKANFKANEIASGLIALGYSKVKLQSNLKVKEPHKCKCNNDGARTVRIVNDLSICPRCGGVIVPVQGKGLVELDEQELRDLIAGELLYLCSTDTVNHPLGFSYKTINNLVDLICSKFGVAQPSISREEIAKILYAQDYKETHDVTSWQVINELWTAQASEGSKTYFLKQAQAILNHLESRKA